MTPEEKRTEKIKLMQLLRKGEIDTLPDVDSPAYKASKIKDMMSKAEGVDEVTSKVGSRISGMIHRPFLANILEKFAEIYQDLIDNGEEFDAQDVIDFLAIEMSKFADDRGLNASFPNEGKVEEDVNEGDAIVDEHEFNFFQTLFGDKYSEEEIEAFLKSNDYQEELKYSDLEEKDFANWDTALDMFVGSIDARGGRLDEGVEWMKRFSGVK
jgi:hypothetical protein